MLVVMPEISVNEIMPEKWFKSKASDEEVNFVLYSIKTMNT